MSSGQGELYLAQENLRDQVVSEWVKNFGILLGIGLTPLLLDRMEIPSWLPGLAAGLLTFTLGVTYSLRQAVSIRRWRAGLNPPLPVGAGTLPPRDIRIHTYEKSEINLLLDTLRLGSVYRLSMTATSLGWLQRALVQPEMQIRVQTLNMLWSEAKRALAEAEPPTLEEFLNKIDDGREEFKHLGNFRTTLGDLSGRLKESDWQAGDALKWMVKQLDYLRRLENVYSPLKVSRQKVRSVASFIKKIQLEEIPARALPGWVESGIQATPGPQTPTFLIAFGILILLPALVGLLVEKGHLENASSIQWYFSSPVIFLWVAAEAVYLYRHWQAGPNGNSRLVGRLKSGLQIVAALTLWNYLGSFFGLKGIGWLFWLAAGLAVGGALLGSLDLSRSLQGRTGLRSAPSPDMPAPERDDSDPIEGQQTDGVPLGRFQVFRGKDEQFYFRLLGRQGEILLVSEGYTSRASCEKSVRSVKKNALLETRFERRTAANGEGYFVLKAGNLQVIGTSGETFESEDDLEREIRNIKDLAPQARIDDLTS